VTPESKSIHNGRTAGRIGAAFRLALAFCGLVGAAGLSQLRKLAQLAALASSVLTAVVRPATWRHTLRRPLVRQILSSGVEATGVVAFLAIALGVLLVAQYQLWLGNVVQSRWLGPLLNAVVVRELGPILVNLVVIARSGGTMAAELALVHVSGEDRVAEGQGLDPVAYFVVPRVVALVVSVSCLTLLLIMFSFLSVYVFGQWIGAKTGSFQEFAHTTLSALTLADVVSLTLKITIPPLLTGCICCLEGFGAGDTTAEVPRAARIAVQRSVIALFTVIAGISIGLYL
jgi:phospholipid/cholesterol/gamma-HCH transport system permease protein